MADHRMSDQLLSALSENTQLFGALSDELKAQFKTVVDSQVESLGLVTREEFDSLRLSLNRCIERMEQLERMLSEQG